MTPVQRALARHALGLPNAKRRSYRNRYFAGKGGPGEREWLAMCAAGEAEHIGDKPVQQSRFALTTVGARAALNPSESLCPEDFPS